MSYEYYTILLCNASGNSGRENSGMMSHYKATMKRALLLALIISF